MAEPRYRALLLGNGKFDKDSGLTCLNGPPTDVKELKKALTDPHTGLFGPNDVTPLHDLGPEDMRKHIADFFGTGRPDDQLLFYYSGHGLHSPKADLYLCTRKTHDNHLMTATSIAARDIHDWMARSRARAKVLVLDCCYAGAFKSSDEIPWRLQGEGIFGLFSCGPNTRSKDAVEPGRPSPFTARLAEALRLGTLDSDGDGFVSIEDVYFYLDDHSWVQANEYVRPFRKLLSPTVGTVALARASRRADLGDGEPPPGWPLRTPPMAPTRPESVIIPDIVPQLVPVPGSAPPLRMGRYLVTNRQFFTFLSDPANAVWCRGGAEAAAHADSAYYLGHWQGDSPVPDTLEDPVVNASAKAALRYLRWASDRVRIRVAATHLQRVEACRPRGPERVGVARG